MGKNINAYVDVLEVFMVYMEKCPLFFPICNRSNIFSNYFTQQLMNSLMMDN